ncbi:hypothetical protein [Shewanella surugensis]|uniref:PilZ domain-containing protein n=1 Tax=Shewanella surugensis TaxID=212020 RepID=A0ABT0LAE0_9GAMM|nr:hypothetical protein [Shewanella surugensis]MCL1124330.1 hypothetical protein [Shewanella surugensis]
MFIDSTPYFSVTHSFQVFVEAWPQETPLPTETQLNALLPVGMQLMSDVKALEADCLLQLRHLDDDAKTIVEYLKLQSRKIDLVLQHVLAQTPHPGEAVKGVRFGGSGIHILTPTPLTPDQPFKLTLYMKEEFIAMICFAKVIDSTLTNKINMPIETLAQASIHNDDPLSHKEQNEAQYLTELRFNVIQDSDIEQLVKASLSVQQKQLKLRKLHPS